MVVDLGSRGITQALFKGQEVSEHPDTEHTLIGVEVLYWEEILDAASSCSETTGLGYLDADL